jgi:uncharacterized membrane protein
MGKFNSKKTTLVLILILGIILIFGVPIYLMRSLYISLYDGWILGVYIATAVVVFLSFLLMYWNFDAFIQITKSENDSRKVENAFKLGERWQSKNISETYSRHCKCNKSECRTDDSCRNARTIFNFFEDILFSLKHDHINKEIAKLQFQEIFQGSYKKCLGWLNNYGINNYPLAHKNINELFNKWK